MMTLAEWRIDQGLSQRALAERMGRKRHATIADIEAGRRRPKLATMREIAEALGLEMRDIKEFADELDRLKRERAHPEG